MKRLAILNLLLCALSVQAQVRTGENKGGDASDRGSFSVSSERLEFQTDLFTGRFSYQVPFALAPGRHDSAPALALNYSSASGEAFCGVGWELDFGYIQRETKNGVPVLWTNNVAQKSYDDNKGFVFSLNGNRSALVKVANEYRSEIEGGFLRFIPLAGSNRWQVIDKSGNKYVFGTNSAGRMSNFKSGWPSNSWNGTYRWALSRVETVLGDTVDYTYTNIGGMLYPLRLSYNGHTSGLTNTHTVDFILGSRSDVRVSYISGYRVEQNRRLDALAHKVSGQIVWSNRLAYAQSSNTFRTMLKSVTRYGTNLSSSLPPITFDYTRQLFGFQSGTYLTNANIPVGGYSDYYNIAFWGTSTVTGQGVQMVDLLDMDGDSVPDRVFMPTFYPYTNLWVQRNNGTGFDNPRSFGPSSVQTYVDPYNNLSTSNSPDWTAINSISMRTLDINGDGLPDRVADPLESYPLSNGDRYTNLVVQLNYGTNWAGGDVRWTKARSEFKVPGDPGWTYYPTIENGVAGLGVVVMAEMNGDNLPDRVMARKYAPWTNFWVQFNTGSGFTETNAFGPFTHEAYQPGTYGQYVDAVYLRLLDINGDGLDDRVMYPTNPVTRMPENVWANLTNYIVEFNNGYGFEPPVRWGGVVGQYTDPYNTYCTEMTGGAGGQLSIQDHEERAFTDMNGDGLLDRVYRSRYLGFYTNLMVQINTGTNFAAPVSYGPYYSQNLINNLDYSAVRGGVARLMDMNGDGIPDRVMPYYPHGMSNWFAVELSKGPMGDLLNSVSNGIGGSMRLAYKSSTLSNNRESTNALSRNLLPFPMQIVDWVSVADGLYPSNKTTYTYEGGKWDANRREFDGFAKTTETDPLGMVNIHWFHQCGGRDNSALGEYQDTVTALGKKGTVFRTETIGTNGQLYRIVLNKVDDADLGSGRHFGYVSQTLELDFPGSTSNYRATARQFAYDLGTGNLTNTTDFGEVTNVVVATHGFADNPNNDTVYVSTVFAVLANTNILDRPQRVTLATDSAGVNILRETLNEYKGTSGALTRECKRICPGSYITNSFDYDSYNNLNSETNEAGVVTSILYEPTYQTFPVQRTAAGTFISRLKYDARSGKVLLSTNVAGLVTSNAYDAFLRVIETAVSTNVNGVPNQWLARYDYRLGMAGGFSTNSVRVRQNDSVDAVNGHETWTYYDGQGRVLQTRVEAETGSYRVTDTVYDKRGSVQFASLPYFSSGTNFTRAVTGLGSLTEYDPVGRPNKITPAVTGSFSSGLLTGTTPTGGDSGSPVGPALLTYNDGADPWGIVATDEENKVHKYSLDAYGRTNQIVEVTGLGNYTTLLWHNLAGDLTNVTDNVGNQIEYAYNDLGQLVAMADPDMGRWDYKRDFGGRLREQVDAETNRIRFDYTDPLGRLKARLIYDPEGNFAYGVTNTYDTSDDPNFPVFAGQLYRTTDTEGWAKSGYDVRGRVVSTARHLSRNGNTYTNRFVYDNADRVVLTVYPNGGPSVTNIFDTGGNLSQVKQVGGSNTVFYAAAGFNALGQLTGINFGNGVATTYGYYANSKRLQQTTTAKGANLQSLGYTYDRVSNLKSISDGLYATNASASLSSIEYDDLHRLISLMRPAIGQTATFSYNSIGNMLANGENGPVGYNYGVRMPHAVKSANGRNYAYDANGNMIVRHNQRLEYDLENRLTNVITPTFTVAFGYDAAGMRLWKQGTNAFQVWIGGNYEEKDGKVLFHILAVGRPVCTFDSTGTNVYAYYHPDHLHSTAIETDPAGNRIQHYEYAAFGLDRFTESATAFPVSRRYTSQVKDEDTGLYYYSSRYYDPLLGRFIQPDTVIPSLADPQHLNRYAYVLNNPLKYNDPSGHAGQTASRAPQIRGVVQNPEINAQIRRDMQRGQNEYEARRRIENSAAQEAKDAARLRRELRGFEKPPPPLPGSGQFIGPLYPKRPPEPKQPTLPPPECVSENAPPSITAEGINNPVPSTLARVIPGEGPFTTLGPPEKTDVFVTDAAAIRGMTPTQIAPRLGIQPAETYTVIQFPPPSQGLASPVSRSDPGFVGRGLTSGKAPEFVIPNGPIPPGATTTIIRSR